MGLLYPEKEGRQSNRGGESTKGCTKTLYTHFYCLGGKRELENRKDRTSPRSLLDKKKNKANGAVEYKENLPFGTERLKITKDAGICLLEDEKEDAKAQSNVAEVWKLTG